MSSETKRIAIVNPYLQGGHTQTAEIESTARFITAAARLGITAEMFGQSEKVATFDPDFIITNTYQEPKLTQYPTYGLLSMPVAWVQDVPRFIRNILSYDGFVTPTPHVIEWLKSLCASYHKPFYNAYAAFSYPETTYQPCDFTQATAVYLGTNWDGKRHQELFTALHDGKHLKCFGPEGSWARYPQTLYGGNVPFDGVSAAKVYAKHGVGLCISHPDFDKEGVPTSRSFEIAAASALPLCSRNTFIESVFGEHALYFDHDLPGEAMAAQIRTHIEWIRKNPEGAEKIAKAAHEICSKKLALEVFIQNIVSMHHEVMQKEYTAIQSARILPLRKKVAYVLSIDEFIDGAKDSLSSIASQTYTDIEIFLLGKTVADYRTLMEEMPPLPHLITFLPYKDLQSNAAVHAALINSGAKWVGFLQSGDILFPNHTARLMQQVTERPAATQCHAVYAGTLEKTLRGCLPEILRDEANTVRQDTVRIGYFNHTYAKNGRTAHSAGMLFDLNKMSYYFFTNLTLNAINTLAVTQYLHNKTTAFVSAITSVCTIHTPTLEKPKPFSEVRRFLSRLRRHWLAEVR
jgi:hypothetical protein